ncbi:MAG: hypothetical protein K2H45_13450 [Acetatifactor sp.]|nr:hypothetical protein [Acetatifactor sp.]
MGKMSREDLFREIGEIDEIYVEEAQRVRRKRRISPWAGRTLVTAASLILCVGVGYVALTLTQGGMNATDGMSGGAMEAAQEMNSVADAKCQDAAGAIEEEETVKQADMGNISAEEGAAGQTPEEAPEAVPALQNDTTDGISNTESDRRQQEQQGDSQECKMESSAIEDTGAEQEIEELTSTTSSGMNLVWEAARTDAVYGRYVDVQVPEGYSYESGIRSADHLHVIWHRGMEEISISCRQADEAVSDWLVDTDISEEYDLGLYSIPWCDSVPVELIQKVNNATFRPDQVTQEIVTARSYQVQEQGDVSGWRTQIAILYSDNVLVEIHSKGPSPEEIYELIYLEN